MALSISKRPLNAHSSQADLERAHLLARSFAPRLPRRQAPSVGPAKNEAPRPPPCPAGGLLGDLFAFDPPSSLWTDLTPAGRGTAPPGPRAAHGFAWLDGGLYVHGGYGDGEPSTVFPICLRD